MKIKERSQDLGWEMRSLVRLNESSDELDIIQATTLGNLLRRAEDQRAGFWVTSLGK